MEMELGGRDDVVDSPPTPLHQAGAAAQATGRRYHECLRNHAAAAGGHVVDGCCEFMPASHDDPLACAACGCHRSFHRRDPSPGRAGAAVHQLPLPLAGSRAPVVPLLLPPPPLPSAAAASKHHRLPFPGYGTPSGGTGTTTESSSEERRRPAPAAPPPRRSRTTFTREQKEQMLALAERVGWRIQRQDEATVEEFCAQAGVRRQALKVWMHNNKHSNKHKQQLLHENTTRQERQQ